MVKLPNGIWSNCRTGMLNYLKLRSYMISGTATDWSVMLSYTYAMAIMDL